MAVNLDVAMNERLPLFDQAERTSVADNDFLLTSMSDDVLLLGSLPSFREDRSGYDSGSLRGNSPKPSPRSAYMQAAMRGADWDDLSVGVFNLDGESDTGEDWLMASGSGEKRVPGMRSRESSRTSSFSTQLSPRMVDRMQAALPSGLTRESLLRMSTAEVVRAAAPASRIPRPFTPRGADSTNQEAATSSPGKPPVPSAHLGQHAAYPGRYGGAAEAAPTAQHQPTMASASQVPDGLLDMDNVSDFLHNDLADGANPIEITPRSESPPPGQSPSYVTDTPTARALAEASHTSSPALPGEVKIHAAPDDQALVAAEPFASPLTTPVHSPYPPRVESMGSLSPVASFRSAQGDTPADSPRSDASLLRPRLPAGDLSPAYSTPCRSSADAFFTPQAAAANTDIACPTEPAPAAPAPPLSSHFTTSRKAEVEPNGEAHAETESLGSVDTSDEEQVYLREEVRRAMMHAEETAEQAAAARAKATEAAEKAKAAKKTRSSTDKGPRHASRANTSSQSTGLLPPTSTPSAPAPPQVETLDALASLNTHVPETDDDDDSAVSTTPPNTSRNRDLAHSQHSQVSPIKEEPPLAIPEGADPRAVRLPARSMRSSSQDAAVGSEVGRLLEITSVNHTRPVPPSWPADLAAAYEDDSAAAHEDDGADDSAAAHDTVLLAVRDEDPADDSAAHERVTFTAHDEDPADDSAATHEHVSLTACVAGSADHSAGVHLENSAAAHQTGSFAARQDDSADRSAAAREEGSGMYDDDMVDESVMFHGSVIEPLGMSESSDAHSGMSSDVAHPRQAVSGTAFDHDPADAFSYGQAEVSGDQQSEQDDLRDFEMIEREIMESALRESEENRHASGVSDAPAVVLPSQRKVIGFDAGSFLTSLGHPAYASSNDDGSQLSGYESHQMDLDEASDSLSNSILMQPGAADQDVMFQGDVFENNNEYSAMPVQDSDDDNARVLEKVDACSTDGALHVPADVLKSGHAGEVNFLDRLSSSCDAVCGVDEMVATEATELDPRQSEVGLDKGSSVKGTRISSPQAIAEREYLPDDAQSELVGAQKPEGIHVEIEHDVETQNMAKPMPACGCGCVIM